MQQEKDDDVQKVKPVDTRHYQGEDNSGHILGSHEAGNSDETMERLRKEEANDQSELNKTDARSKVGGNEAV